MKRITDLSWKKALVMLLVVLIGVWLVWSNSRTVEQSGSQTVEQPSSRAVEQSGSRTVEQPNSRTVGQSDSQEAELADRLTFVQMKISKEQLFGKLDPARHEDFVAVDARYANRVGMYMHVEAYEAFRNMHAAALADGVGLTVVSAMRTFDYQKRIWENKWNGRQLLDGDIRATSIADPTQRALEILRFSAMPGTSRHHWGTDIDLNSLVNSYFEAGEGEKVYAWLQNHAASFGFCQPYTAMGEGRQGGYEEEKWHWSYSRVASTYLKAYLETVSDDDIRGFDGWETAAEIGVIENYVANVSGLCR